MVESVGPLEVVKFKNKDGTVRESSCIVVKLKDSSLVDAVTILYR